MTHSVTTVYSFENHGVHMLPIESRGRTPKTKITLVFSVLGSLDSLPVVWSADESQAVADQTLARVTRDPRTEKTSVTSV